jgi:hypothetical protein
LSGRGAVGEKLLTRKSRSLHATRAPYRASAIPLPMLGPAPVTSATFPSSDMSTAASQPLGLATAPDPADAVTVIIAPSVAGAHDI